MTGVWLAAGVLAVAIAVATPSRPRRSRELSGAVPLPRDGAERPSAAASADHDVSIAVRAVGAIGAGAAVAAAAGSASSVASVLVALGAGAAAWWALGRFEPAGRRRERERALRDLPFAVDLLAACLAAGAPTAAALRLAGSGVGGPVGAAFVRAAAALELGGSAAEAIASWRASPGGAALDPVARLLVRSAASGTALVPAATRLSVDLRESRRWQVDELARRVGVRATAPLGVCFLPAFVLLGIVPIVVVGARTFVV